MAAGLLPRKIITTINIDVRSINKVNKIMKGNQRICLTIRILIKNGNTEELPYCSLDADINSCIFYEKENGKCNNPNLSCSMLKENNRTTPAAAYIRQERWYEKFNR